MIVTVSFCLFRVCFQHRCRDWIRLFLADLDFSRLSLETVPLVRAIAEGHHAGAATAAPSLNDLSINHY